MSFPFSAVFFERVFVLTATVGAPCFPQFSAKKYNRNQDDFAKVIRVSRQTISSIETGKYNPSLELAFIISDFFDKRIEEVFIYERGTGHEKK